MVTPKVIGRYEIIEELGRGAMGSVFKARDPIVGRLVALKTIHSAALEGEQSAEYRARFQREARASGVLAHPGIVPVFDVGEHEGAPFLVMEFVEGRTLDSAIKKGERFTLDRVCEMGQQVAEALGYAHRQGVIHRDIKPANILMTSREVYGSERPRITDFGIAKLAASEITTTGQLLGTPAYMPPEQFTGAPIDGRADLFSVGVILYSLATGEQPFPGETMTAVSYKVVYTDPIPPAKLNPGISASIEGVILKCLAKSPAARYQTGEELARDLAAIRAGTTVAPGVAPLTAKIDPNATLAAAPSKISHPPGPLPVLPAKKKSVPAPGTKPSGKLPLIGALAAVVVLAAAGAGWYFVLHRRQPEPEKPQATTVPAPQPVVPPPASETEPSPPPTAVVGELKPDEPETGPEAKTAPAAPTPATPGPAKTTPAKPMGATPAKPKPSAATAKPAPSPAPPPPAQPAVASTAPAPQPSPAAPPAHAATTTPAAPVFDPRKADPNANAKLKIELGKFPNGLQFTVDMDRKPYLSFVTGDGSSLDNLYVPPGVQSFRVILKSGGQDFESNIVSDDFKAKKKKTLKIQLKLQDVTVTNVTVPIDKSTTVFLSWGNILSAL